MLVMVHVYNNILQIQFLKIPKEVIFVRNVGDQDFHTVYLCFQRRTILFIVFLLLRQHFFAMYIKRKVKVLNINAIDMFYV